MYKFSCNDPLKPMLFHDTFTNPHKTSPTASSFYFVSHFLALPVVLTIKHLIPQKMQLNTLINF